jgi:lipopolysaccharide O-acetyltransferase
MEKDFDVFKFEKRMKSNIFNFRVIMGLKKTNSEKIKKLLYKINLIQFALGQTRLFSRVFSFFIRYGLIGTVRLIRDLLITKILFKNARLIRYPFYIRGRTKILIGRNFTSGVGLRVDAFGASGQTQIEFGEHVQVGDYVHIAAIESVVIGNDVLIASKVYISDHNHGVYSGLNQSFADEIQYAKKLSVLPVKIGNNAWIGEGVMILPGVNIGENCVIGAGAVVTKSIEPNSIAVGNPARVVKIWNNDQKTWLKVN